MAKRWSQEEDDLVKKYYDGSSASYDILEKKLPARNRETIKMRASNLKIIKGTLRTPQCVKDGKKDCRKCNKRKPLSDFHTDNRMKSSGYVTSYCKECERRYRIEKVYGMPYEQYVTMLKKQNYSCLICEQKHDETSVALAVDHNHNTGEVRGLLCRTCNAAIGALGDNVEGLQRAIEYLENASS